MNNEESTFETLIQSGIIAVLVIDSAEDAVPVAEALLAGGVDAMELTLRTPAAIDALRHIRSKVPRMLAGIGTILSPAQVTDVVEAGASFGVSPGMNPRVVEAALNLGLPFAPGIITPSDIERALEFDRKLLKFFPAETSGGLEYLKNIAAPYHHLGIAYVPLGGINEANCATYLESNLIAGIGGSWLAPRDLIHSKSWGEITSRAEKAIAIRNAVRGQ
jgi:2-dehydro-3-deoxyphosphogluconate aldolase/(4S)-4-hydroxy-2-oxoglutarate aldolase